MSEIESRISDILEEVKTTGDEAIRRFTLKFDGIDLLPEKFLVPERQIAGVFEDLPGDLKTALKEAAKRIRRFHEKIKPEDQIFTGPDDELLGEKWSPLSSAGIYAPGGRAAYPSTVLMAAIPAQVAGVKRIVVTSPPGRDGISKLVLAACDLIGIKEVYQVGGAQAIAALAYGTQTIKRVDKIAGPGNTYVTCAKKLLYGTVGIDFLAGPSEVVVICDETASAAAIAIELLAQAEHDPEAHVYCLCVGEVSIEKILQEIEKQRTGLPGYVVEVLGRKDVFRSFPDLESALEESEKIAPEHLSLKVKNPRDCLKLIQRAGAVMLGESTPVPIGDYFAGPSHVLPTGGTARFSSGLGTRDFMRSTHVLQTSPGYLKRWGPLAARIALAEGLEAHARAMLQNDEKKI